MKEALEEGKIKHLFGWEMAEFENVDEGKKAMKEACRGGDRFETQPIDIKKKTGEPSWVSHCLSIY